MAYDYLGLVNDVNRRLNEVELTKDNFDTAVGFYSAVKENINSSIRFINQEQFGWPFNHVEQEEYLSTGEVRYAYPSDAKTIDFNTFRIKRSDTFNTGTRRLKSITYEEYLESYVDLEYQTSDAHNAVPRFVFRTPSQEYGIVPPPNNDYEIVYEYYRLPVDLASATDVPTVPESFRHVIVDGAMYYAYLFRGNTQDATLAYSKYIDGIKNMRTLYVNRYDVVRSTAVQNGSRSSTAKVF
jgi:hypothetical protein